MDTFVSAANNLVKLRLYRASRNYNIFIITMFDYKIDSRID